MRTDGEWKGKLRKFISDYRLQSTKTSDFDVILLEDFIEALLKGEREELARAVKKLKMPSHFSVPQNSGFTYAVRSIRKLLSELGEE